MAELQYIRVRFDGCNVNLLVGTGRFELPTCRLGGGRSIHLSYVPAIASLPAAQAFPADVLPVLHAVEVNVFDRAIGVRNGGGKGTALRRNP